MYQPISCDFYDQLEVAIQRKIPSTVVFQTDTQTQTKKGLVSTLDIIEGIEYLVLNDEHIPLDKVISFNGRKYIEED